MSKLTSSEIVESLKQFTLLEINELVKSIEETFGVSADFSLASGSSEDSASKEDAQSEFSMNLISPGANKIAVIKVIREITGLGLMEAKKMVDVVPSVIKPDVPASEVEALKKKFVDAGATVEFK